jgi:hypothetical protein
MYQLNSLEADLFATLRVLHKDDDRDLLRLQSRMVGVGLFSFCSRCGGCGRYSFNQIDGDRCYGCGGSGKIARRITSAVLAEAKEIAASGKLASYLQELGARQQAERAARTANKRVMAAWQASGVSAAYDWRKASSVDYDREVAERVNKPMYEAHEMVRRASEALDILRFSRPRTAEERESLDLQVAAALQALSQTTEQALLNIVSAAQLLPSIKAKHGCDVLQPCA